MSIYWTEISEILNLFSLNEQKKFWSIKKKIIFIFYFFNYLIKFQFEFFFCLLRSFCKGFFLGMFWYFNINVFSWEKKLFFMKLNNFFRIVLSNWSRKCWILNGWQRCWFGSLSWESKRIIAIEKGPQE